MTPRTNLSHDLSLAPSSAVVDASLTPFMPVLDPAHVLALALVVLLTWRTFSRPVRRLPPGPTPKPLIGNLFDFPRATQWLAYHAWAQKYGDVVFLEALGQKILILDSEKTAIDLMDRRGVTYSARMRSNILDLMGFDWMLTLLPYTDRWRTQRRLFHGQLHAGAIAKYTAPQLAAAQRLALSLSRTPDGLSGRARAALGGAVMRLVYGIEVAPAGGDPYVDLAEQVIEFFNLAALPGRYLVDVFAPLKYVPAWFPGARFKREAAEAQRLHRNLRDFPMSHVKDAMATGSGPPSIVRDMLAAIKPGDTVGEQMITDIAGNAYLAGMDTTVGALMSFFLAILVHPEVQIKAQAEIDAVVGRERLPTFADRERLPYVEGVVSEAFRWIPTVPLGFPHVNTADDEYRGYFIPKGTVVIANTWAMLYDPITYPDPERFNPERYLRRTESGAFAYDKSVRDPRATCFGFGRRRCPGRSLADQMLYASIVTCLATLTFSPAKDARGIPRPPKVELTDGLLCHPKPFDYEITPRTIRTELLLEQALAD